MIGEMRLLMWRGTHPQWSSLLNCSAAVLISPAPPGSYLVGQDWHWTRRRPTSSTSGRCPRSRKQLDRQPQRCLHRHQPRRVPLSKLGKLPEQPRPLFRRHP